MASRAERVERLHALQREEAMDRARSGLLNFVRWMRPDYRINWHHRLICQQLNRLIAGDIKRLMICTPPRHGKSEIVSRHLPAFLLGRNPDTQVISASYAAALAEAMNRDVQRIITAPGFRELFPKTRLNEKNIRTVADGTWLRNSETFEIVGRRGYYLCAGVGGPLTGRGGDVGIIDDPIKSWEEAYSEAFRARVWSWYTSVFYTRMSKGAPICVTLTRWHEDDLGGRLLAQAKADPKADQWTVLNLPALKEDPPSEQDPREIGEALWPERYPAEELEKIRAVDARVFASLYQGSPSPADGDIIKREHWQLYPLPVGAAFDELVASMEWLVLSADLTFKDKENSDYCAYQVWGRRGAHKYLLDTVRARLSYPAQKRTLKTLLERYPRLGAIYIEDAATGAPLVAELRDSIPGLIAVPPQGSKVARARAISPQAEAGQLHVPDPKTCSWSAEYLEEWAKFPAGKHDDQVDATTLAIAKLGQGSTAPIHIPVGGKDPLFLPGGALESDDNDVAW